MRLSSVPPLHSLSAGPDSTAKVIGAIERGVTPRWMEMGLLLGLDYRKLDAIRADDALDGVSERAAAMVKVWFKQKQDTDNFGYPSWKRLVEVIGSPAGGKDKALARMIAAEHPRRERRTVGLDIFADKKVILFELQKI